MRPYVTAEGNVDLQILKTNGPKFKTSLPTMAFWGEKWSSVGDLFLSLPLMDTEVEVKYINIDTTAEKLKFLLSYCINPAWRGIKPCEEFFG